MVVEVAVGVAGRRSPVWNQKLRKPSEVASGRFQYSWIITSGSFGPDLDFADLAYRHLEVVLVGQPHGVVGRGQADRADPAHRRVFWIVIPVSVIP